MFNLLLKTELKNIEAHKQNYAVQRLKANMAVEKAQSQCAELMGEPSVLAAIVTVGAFKGATSPNVTQQRKTALTSIAKTGLFSLFR
ncbi:hypothetical protein [Alteromonas sp. S167]|uniref:hypothetical protein n=1 Tax=Alteromonas sp. S167 TaxID=3117402 RepID=UPI002FE333E5